MTTAGSAASSSREPEARFWAGRSVCVTGGTGFLGYHLVKQLLALGARVRVLALPPPADHPLLSLPEVEMLAGDICDPQCVRSAVAGCATIFHTAGIIAFWGPALQRIHAVHVEGTTNVLRAAEAGSRIVHTSSVMAVGPSQRGGEQTEDSPFQRDALCLPYVRAKLAAEEIALRAAESQDVVVTNPTYLLGPEDYEPSPMGHYCVRFWKGRAPVVLPGGQNLVDVRDVATGHLLAAEHGRVGRRYILGGENHDYRSLAGMLAEAAGFRPRALLSLPWSGMYLTGVLAEWRFWLTGEKPYPSRGHAHLHRFEWFSNSSRAMEELGYRPRPLRQALTESLNWHRSRASLQLRGVNRWLMRPAG